ncbi:hypothetical protein B9G53_20145 [Pseudanabaena sp. SR411]|uniref:hypothetical protein n=1 Tax=Pseudanabaena sp. SR411 TaxID=1980935 RepID=UPI000B982FC8|nr:hypothetical protein [Pseudanabaena sp. SR411]OYQ62850.1 hypothetical protein B9G53_20145 [Pseudanabaena sp. SR411]
MFDLSQAQHLLTSVTSADLSFHLSAIDVPSNLHFNIADLNSHINMDLLAQQFKQDVMGDLGKGWNNFVKTGQIWALIIGVVVGYLFRSITNA